MATTSPIQIDLDAILTQRLGWKARLLPNWLVTKLKNLIHQDRMNEVLRRLFPRRGAEFCTGLLELLEVNISVQNADRLPASPRCLFVSNHPLGGLDGIAMIAWLKKQYPQANPLFVVNDLLMAVEPLRECFVPVNKHGSQSRFAVQSLDAALASDNPVVIYPAGLVSRLGDNGIVADLEWKHSFVGRAISSRRDVVPVHFGGHNSERFYRLARRRKKLGIKFNFEMILLPDEMFRGAGSSFTLTCGTPISWQSLAADPDPRGWAARIRNEVYSLNSIEA